MRATSAHLHRLGLNPPEQLELACGDEIRAKSEPMRGSGIRCAAQQAWSMKDPGKGQHGSPLVALSSVNCVGAGNHPRPDDAEGAVGKQALNPGPH